MTAISGSNVSLQISNLSTNYEQLTWLYSVHQKILEWELNKINLFNSKFKNRVSLNGNQALSIVNVQKEDSSTYILRVLKESGKEEEWHISLEVFGEFGESPSRAPDGPLGGFLGFMGVLSGRSTEKPQDRLHSFLLEPFPLGSEPGSAELKLIALGHLKVLLTLVSLRCEEQENLRNYFLSILFMLSCGQCKAVLS